MSDKTSTPAAPAAKKPKVFVSYSWTNQEHVDRILAWCERLVSDGVDVEIDRWSLSEGDEKYAFMERMVTDPSITHVLIFSDARYTQRANERAKGVGTESQIISAELYGRTTQDKFLPIVCEFDEQGEACVPVFLKGRIYFNFSTPEAALENWEKLIRRIYNRPALTKPKLGKSPSYLEAGAAPAMTSTSKFLVLKDAVQKGRPNVRLWLNDYLDALDQQMEEYRVDTRVRDTEEAASILRARLDAMLPVRNEIVELFAIMISSQPPGEAADTIGDLMERLLAFRYRRIEGQGYQDWWFEAYAFFAHEAFLYAIAAHVRLRHFEGAAALLSRRYVVPENTRGASRARSFTVFRSFSRVLSDLNQHSHEQRLSMEADLLSQRATLPSYPLMMLMQSDLLCCARTLAHPQDYDIWPPVTTVYAEYLGTLDIFLRAEDRRLFQQITPVIGVESKDDLVARLTAGAKQQGDRLNWLFRYGNLSLESLIGLENLGTRG